jgi:hypothetical protein
MQESRGPSSANDAAPTTVLFPTYDLRSWLPHTGGIMSHGDAGSEAFDSWEEQMDINHLPEHNYNKSRGRAYWSKLQCKRLVHRCDVYTI